MSAPDPGFGAPGYWMFEVSGILRPVIEAYINNRRLTASEVRTMRCYLRQWIMAPGFIGPDIDALRWEVNQIQTQEDIHAWIGKAVEVGCDPL